MARPAPRLTVLTFVIATVVVIGGFASFLFFNGFANPGPPPGPPALGNFSGFATTSGNCSGACPAVILGVNNLPQVANVTVRWTDVTGGRVFFTVWNPSQEVDCGNGTSGSCVFDSMGGNCTFHAHDVGSQFPQRVDYVGSYP